MFNKYKDEYSFNSICKIYQRIIELYYLKMMKNLFHIKLKESISTYDSIKEKKKTNNIKNIKKVFFFNLN